MSSTTPATKLTRRTTVEELVPGKASGTTLLFRSADTSNSDEAFAWVVWDQVAGREAFADVAVESRPKSRLFGAPTLSAVLLDAFEWAEQEASR